MTPSAADESKILDQIARDRSESDPVRRWIAWHREATEKSVSAGGRRWLHEQCFVPADGGAGTAPELAPIWLPEMDDRPSNVRRWMDDLAFEDYQTFHQWSVTERAEFWAQAVDRLGVRFHDRGQEVLDVTQGVQRAAWFPEARLNITQSCFQASAASPAVIAIGVDGAQSIWTVSELEARAARVANSLVDAGFKVGDAIGIFMPMTKWSVAIYLGVVMAGCHVVSIADSFAPPEIETRLRISNAKAIFTYDVQVRAGKQLPLFRRLIEATQSPAIVLAQDHTLQVDLRQQDLDWDEFLVSRDEFEPVVCQAQETINVLFSSGTTGEPKAIPWNHLTPIKCAIDGYCHQNIMPGDVCAWPTNLGWMMGPWLIFASLINRATIALYEDAPMGPGFGRFVQEAGVTMLGVVPTIVKAWQASGDMDSFDWSQIKVFSSTGESSQPATMTYLSSLAGFQPVIEYCGGTEIGGGYVSSVVEKANYPAAFNTPAVGIDFVLLESATESQDGVGPPGSDGQASESNRQPDASSTSGFPQGEVFLLPPSIGLSNRLINRDHFKTYYADTPVMAGVGPLRRHGDYFRRIMTPQGEIFVAGGRVDDTMNLGGIKVSSAEIERVLNQCQGVLETAAVAESSSNQPDRLVVFAVCQASVQTRSPAKRSEAEDALRQDMNVLLKRELNPLFRVHELRLVDALPRTASGKVMRRMLRSN